VVADSVSELVVVNLTPKGVLEDILDTIVPE
jgi:hypothetical protein